MLNEFFDSATLAQYEVPNLPIIENSYLHSYTYGQFSENVYCVGTLG